MALKEALMSDGDDIFTDPHTFFLHLSSQTPQQVLQFDFLFDFHARRTSTLGR